VSHEDGELDYYWVSRVSGLMIRGGANYSCEQIARDIQGVIQREFGLKPDEFDAAVVGLKRGSEHEDDCCVTVELKSHRARSRRGDLEEGLTARCAKELPKAMVPDVLRFGEIPRNFKGALQGAVLEREYRRWLEGESDEGKQETKQP
jgi:acyl-CoA synthetase (AMP-forming)/AMP-acid ligase II